MFSSPMTLENRLTTNCTIAFAQSGSRKGDIEANLLAHYEYVHVAARSGSRLLVFPELSLTGYEPQLASALALTPDDYRLQTLASLSKQFKMTIVAGAPILGPYERPYLGAIVFSPSGIRTYYKLHLHPGEDLYFSPGSDICIIDVNEIAVGMAICADTSHPSHVAEVAAGRATVYAAGVLLTNGGFQKDADMMQNYALAHGIAVGFANHTLSTGGYLPAGKSSMWNNQGRLIAQALGTEACLVLGRCCPDGWQGEVVPIP